MTSYLVPNYSKGVFDRERERRGRERCFYCKGVFVYKSIDSRPNDCHLNQFNRLLGSCLTPLIIPLSDVSGREVT